MSKLIKLKKWLTVEAAAEYISNELSEPVTVADIYHFAIERHLQLSVHLINNVMARKGRLFKVENENSKWFHLSQRVYPINGVWDLAMFGDERLDIEHHFQQETSGFEVTLPSCKGVFLRKGHIVSQLHIDYDDDEGQLGSKASKITLDSYLAENKIGNETKLKLLAEYKKNRSEFINSRKNKPDKYKYFPSSTLDDHENDYTLVVRTNEVTKFIQSLNNTPQEEKSLTTNERNSLLVLIGALCKEVDIVPNKRGASVPLVMMTELIGAPLSNETIRKILNQVEPAISARSK